MDEDTEEEEEEDAALTTTTRGVATASTCGGDEKEYTKNTMEGASIDKHVQFDVKEDQYNGSGLGISGSNVPGVSNINDDEEMEGDDKITVHENSGVTKFQDSVRWTSVVFKFKMPIDAES